MGSAKGAAREAVAATALRSGVSLLISSESRSICRSSSCAFAESICFASKRNTA